jgi:serine/threonine protein kinase
MLGRVIADRYKIRRLIAKGGMGSVYEAEQMPLGRKVALKILVEPPNSGDTEAFQQRFFLEAATLAKLDHPHTVTLHDYGRTPDDIFYLVMEYVDGVPLSRMLQAEGPIDPQRAVTLITQVARALRNAHENGVIHRDLKPGNLLVKVDMDGNDMVKVVDFGLVKLTEGDQAITVTGMIMGSPHCMAPEQVQGAAVDERADIYALGVLLFRCVTGQYPFHGSTTTATMIAHINHPIPKLAEKAPNLQVPDGFEAFIGRCLAKNPEQRFSSMRAVVKELRLLSDVPSEEFTAVSTIVEAPPDPTNRNNRLLMGAVGVLALAALAVGIWSLTQNPSVDPAPAPVPVVETAMVRFDTEPSGATVWTKGQELGNTPLELTLELGGTPDIRRYEFRKDGYVTTTVDRDISSDRAIQVTLTADTSPVMERELPPDPVVETPPVERPPVRQPPAERPVRQPPRETAQTDEPGSGSQDTPPTTDASTEQGAGTDEDDAPAGYKGNPFD